MASRNCKRDAEKLVFCLQAQYPDREFAVRRVSKVMKVGRLAAEPSSVIEDTGGPMVTAEVVTYDVLEVRPCACGTMTYSSAIGEDSLAECSACREARQARQKAKSEAEWNISEMSRFRGEEFDRFWE